MLFLAGDRIHLAIPVVARQCDEYHDDSSNQSSTFHDRLPSLNTHELTIAIQPRLRPLRALAASYDNQLTRLAAIPVNKTRSAKNEGDQDPQHEFTYIGVGLAIPSPHLGHDTNRFQAHAGPKRFAA